MLISIGACPAYLRDIVFAVGGPAAAPNAKPKLAVEAGQPTVAEVQVERVNEAEPTTERVAEKTEPVAATAKPAPRQEDLDLAGNGKEPSASKTAGPDRQD
jgi:hypothetical protein